MYANLVINTRVCVNNINFMEKPLMIKKKCKLNYHVQSIYLVYCAPYSRSHRLFKYMVVCCFILHPYKDPAPSGDY